MIRTTNAPPAGYAKALLEAVRLGGITHDQAAQIHATLTDAANTIYDEIGEGLHISAHGARRLLRQRADRLSALAEALAAENLAQA